MTNVKMNDTNDLIVEEDILDGLEEGNGLEDRSPVVQERDGTPAKDKPGQDKSTEMDEFDLWDEESETRSPIVQERVKQPVPSKKPSRKPRKPRKK